MHPLIVLLLLFTAITAIANAHNTGATVNCKESYATQDCDASAICYTEAYNVVQCKCPSGYIDKSPQPSTKPGRKCELEPPPRRDACSQNDCSPSATCQPTGDSYQREVTGHAYTCICRAGLKDMSPDVTNKPGRICVQPETCATTGRTVCSPNADCIDLQPTGFECRCKANFDDHSQELPSKPGRVCTEHDPCANNNCDVNAVCQRDSYGNTYTCICGPGFIDSTTTPHDPQTKGRHCSAVTQAPSPTVAITPVVASQVDAEPCGNEVCHTQLGEVCVDGKCVCPEGEGRSNKTEVCRPVEKIPFAVRVINNGATPLLYSSDLGDYKSAPHAQIVDEFDRDLGKAIATTDFAPKYVNTDVTKISHPKAVNSSWPNGILLNFTVGVTPTQPPVNRCELWDKMVESFRASNNNIGGGELKVADDLDQLNPCPPPVELCGGAVCNVSLGEVCVAGSVCGCPSGEKRASPKDKCRPVEPFIVPLWVIRKDKTPLNYNSTFANTEDAIHKDYVNLFQSGVAQSYPNTPLKQPFVTAEVNDIGNPKLVNQSWDLGLIFNSSMWFDKGALPGGAEAAKTALIRYIIDKNNYQVGQSGLYLNPCLENSCSEHAQCIPLDNNKYKCECLAGFEDAAVPPAIPGSVCNYLPCSDVTFCPANSTCQNINHEAVCVCLPGFIDISTNEKKATIVSLASDAKCISAADVCALGLHNCSSVAICKPSSNGTYSCMCPADYEDLEPVNPGHQCAAKQCGLCNGQGDCITDPVTHNVTCACMTGFTGEFCELTAANVPMILFLILALLFLLLTLCCLLYLCTRCRCFKRDRGLPWSSLDQSGSSDLSDLYGGNQLAIPRAKLARSESGSSGYTIREEIERTVNTEVTRTEMRTEATEDEINEVMDKHYSSTTNHEYLPSSMTEESRHKYY